jgi:hypothetical protein
MEIIRIEIILGSSRPPGGRGLSQQIADGRFVYLVATHQLLHDRLGQELIKRRFI